jgi:hypothetical protein
MRTNWKGHRRSKPANALERLDSRLGAQCEAACHAERINLLGRHMFGDLWDDEATQPESATPIGLPPCASVVRNPAL